MVNSNFGFTSLKEVWLGDCYPEAFYDHLPNEIADPFRQITEWTKQDLAKCQRFLESLGIVVRRPIFGSIDNYLDQHNQLAKPPITPRDDYLVVGQTLYSLHNHLKSDPWNHMLDYYKSQHYDVRTPVDQAINCLYPPSVVRIGRDLYVDSLTHQKVWGYVCEALIDLAKEYRVNICNTDGHSDAVFCPVQSGLLVTTHYKTDYSQSFPGWKVLTIPPLYHNHTNWKDWTLNNPIIDNNTAFAQHIIDNAQAWVGNYKETVFEVNMLVVDQHNVICMKEYEPLFRQLEQHGITAHVFDFRCRNFWDGGWHCLTLDIHRDDTKDDLFPQRGDNGVYWRLK